jgi:hypothetical protein
VRGEEELKHKNHKIKLRVVIYGFLAVVAMAVSTYLQVTYLERFFRAKKLM